MKTQSKGQTYYPHEEVRRTVAWNRVWDALDESVGNLNPWTHTKDTAGPCRFASFGVSTKVHPTHLIRCIGGGVIIPRAESDV